MPDWLDRLDSVEFSTLCAVIGVLSFTAVFVAVATVVLLALT